MDRLSLARELPVDLSSDWNRYRPDLESPLPAGQRIFPMFGPDLAVSNSAAREAYSQVGRYPRERHELEG